MTAQVAEGSEKHIPGEAGMWIFIFGDMMLFLAYFANYLLVRRGQSQPFSESQLALDQNYGALNTAVMLLSSLFVLLGLRAIRNRDTVTGPRMFLGALVCAFAFVALKASEWAAKIAHGITPETDSFFQFYYILTGLHLVHVVFGIIILALILGQARKAKISPGKFMAVEGGCCWWHMVDLVWMILFPLVYLAK